MRKSPFIALLAGVMLLSAGLLAMAGSLAQAHQQDKTLQRDATQVAFAFNSYFERARALDLLLAQDPTFTPSDGRAVNNAAANRALAYLERLYPGAIGEACLIDEEGHEAARVTRGVGAPVSELSTSEASNPFFGPTFELRPGKVFQAHPYVSVDTGQWVISNSTWIPQAKGKRLIVHFEVALKSFNRYLNASGSRHVAVVDLTSGRSVLQDGKPLPTTHPAGRFNPFEAADELQSSSAIAETVEANDQRLAVGRVARSAGNANEWAIVEWSTGRASFLPPWVGAGAALMGLACILFFMLALRRQQGTLRMAARLDHLTGLPNRKALEEALEEAVSAATRPGGDRVAILMLDLDGFKEVNDALGHDKGDLVLQEIGRRLAANTFEYDTAARLGGDEFAVVLRRLRDADDVASVAHRLREALVRPIDIDGSPKFIGVSIGASVYAEHGRSSAEMLRGADSAMYQAKRGREGVRVYNTGTALGADASGVAAQLLLVIENDELALAFQPEFSLDTGRIIGIEALARWHRHGQPDVPPSQFIPLAERTGLIRQLTLLTLRKALDEALLWRTRGLHIPVSVNLSAQLVADRSLHPRVVDMLTERGLSGDALVLEITETAVVADLDIAVHVLADLRSLGVRIELDDFGSGFASFKALHELPLDGVKIDNVLVNDASPEGRRLLAATIDMARSMGLDIVAEGIEDEEVLDIVRGLGAHTAQGYLLARPMDAERLHLRLAMQNPVTTGI